MIIPNFEFKCGSWRKYLLLMADVSSSGNHSLRFERQSNAGLSFQNSNGWLQTLNTGYHFNLNFNKVSS